jgi:hypothetical protein
MIETVPMYYGKNVLGVSSPRSSEEPHRFPLILTQFQQKQLNLSVDQRRALRALQEEVLSKLDSIFTTHQSAHLRDLLAGSSGLDEVESRKLLSAKPDVLVVDDLQPNPKPGASSGLQIPIPPVAP